MGFQGAVQFIQHDARAHHAAQILDIQFENVVEILGVVDHQSLVDGLAALRRAATARQDGHALLLGPADCRFNVVLDVGRQPRRAASSDRSRHPSRNVPANSGQTGHRPESRDAESSSPGVHGIVQQFLGRRAEYSLDLIMNS